jgi:hypothetical protein
MKRLFLLLLILLDSLAFGQGAVVGQKAVVSNKGTLSPGVAAAGPAFVQASSGTCFFGGSASCASSALAANDTAHNNLTVFVYWGDVTNTLSSITLGGGCPDTITLGTTYTSTAGGNASLAFGTAKNIAGGAQCTATAVLSASVSEHYLIYLVENSGIATTGTITDGSNAAGAGFTGIGSTMSCGAVTTGTSGDLVMCFMVDTGYNGGTLTAGATYSIVGTPQNTHSESATLENKVQSAAGSITPTFTDSTTSDPFGITLALKP